MDLHPSVRRICAPFGLVAGQSELDLERRQCRGMSEDGGVLDVKQECSEGSPEEYSGLSNRMRCIAHYWTRSPLGRFFFYPCVPLRLQVIPSSFVHPQQLSARSSTDMAPGKRHSRMTGLGLKRPHLRYKVRKLPQSMWANSWCIRMAHIFPNT